MTTKNDITGDSIKSRPNSEAYRNSPYWDSIGQTEKPEGEDKPKESLKWRVRFKTTNDMYSFVDISRKVNPVLLEEVQEWAEMKLESEEYFASIDAIEAL